MKRNFMNVFKTLLIYYMHSSHSFLSSVVSKFCRQKKMYPLSIWWWRISWFPTRSLRAWMWRLVGALCPQCITLQACPTIPSYVPTFCALVWLICLVVLFMVWMLATLFTIIALTVTCNSFFVYVAHVVLVEEKFPLVYSKTFYGDSSRAWGCVWSF